MLIHRSILYNVIVYLCLDSWYVLQVSITIYSILEKRARGGRGATLAFSRRYDLWIRLERGV